MKRLALRKRLLWDFVFIAMAIILAVVLDALGVMHAVIDLTSDFSVLEAFLSGVFFTSAFTTPFSIALFLEMGVEGVPPVSTALIGASGAVLGDYILFRFVRDRFGADLLALFRHKKTAALRGFMEMRLFRFLTFIFAGLIIASPLPDELAVALFGFTKVKSLPFLLVSFLFNFLGILSLLLVGQGLAR